MWDLHARPGSSKRMNLYLGIDGGGTRTRAVLVDAHGGIHGEGEAGPANYHNVGLEGAAAALRRAAENAWQAAGRPFDAAAACFAGLAGIKAGIDFSRLSDVAATVGLALPGRITVANDLHNALAGGLAGRPGVALIAGTGTNCLARDASGATFMCGGWGWLLDDRGGGIGLALAGLRAATRAADGRGGVDGTPPGGPGVLRPGGTGPTPRTSLLPAGCAGRGRPFCEGRHPAGRRRGRRWPSPFWMRGRRLWPNWSRVPCAN